MNYLKQAQELKKWWNVINKDWKGCVYQEIQEKSISLRNTIFGVSMMKGSKSKDDEEAVNILDEITHYDTKPKSI